ncbi:MAG TPA: RelA/SpoT domain-containing protein [Candidatus Binatia bacterium]
MQPIRRALLLAGAPLLAGLLACTQVAAPTQAQAACPAGDYTVAQYQNLTPAQQTQFVENYRRQYAPVLEKVLETLRASGLDPPLRVLGRLKVVESIQEKIVRKKYACFSELTDIAGARIIIPSYAALPLVTQNVENALRIVEKEDLIMDRRGTGYRAIHYLALVDGRLAEIQIHTHRGTIWAEASHRLVYKGPFADNQAVISYLYRLSEAIFWLDSDHLRELPMVAGALPPDAREDLIKVVASINDFGKQTAAELNRFYEQLALEMLEHDSFDLDDVSGLSAGFTTWRKVTGESPSREP